MARRASKAGVEGKPAVEKPTARALLDCYLTAQRGGVIAKSVSLDPAAVEALALGREMLTKAGVKRTTDSLVVRTALHVLVAWLLGDLDESGAG